MNKDIVIYLEETRDIIAIITNAELDKNSEQILNKGIAIAEVDSNENYIFGDGHDIKLINPDSKIIYLDDYRRR